MKIIITGASGLLGRAVRKELEADKTLEVISLAYTRLEGGLRKLDLNDEAEVIKTINELQPDVLIHSAAERRPDVVMNNEREAENLNVKATETLAKAIDTIGGFMLYISTDYVFDGTKPPYKTDDVPNPSNTYGLLKLEGEKRCLKMCRNAGVLRVPILYGDVQYLDESAVTVLFPLLKNKSTSATVSNYEQRYPTSTEDIAVKIHQILEHRKTHPDFGGIWHWRSNDKLTKYKMVEVMSKVFNLPMSHIEPQNEASGGAARPYDTELDCADLEEIGISRRTTFSEGIKKCLEPFLNK